MGLYDPFQGFNLSNQVIWQIRTYAFMLDPILSFCYARLTPNENCYEHFRVYSVICSVCPTPNFLPQFLKTKLKPPWSVFLWVFMFSSFPGNFHENDSRITSNHFRLAQVHIKQEYHKSSYFLKKNYVTFIDSSSLLWLLKNKTRGL